MHLTLSTIYASDAQHRSTYQRYDAPNAQYRQTATMTSLSSHLPSYQPSSTSDVSPSTFDVALLPHFMSASESCVGIVLKDHVYIALEKADVE